jgi:hypothetical protein
MQGLDKHIDLTSFIRSKVTQIRMSRFKFDLIFTAASDINQVLEIQVLGISKLTDSQGRSFLINDIKKEGASLTNLLEETVRAISINIEGGVDIELGTISISLRNDSAQFESIIIKLDNKIYVG